MSRSKKSLFTKLLAAMVPTTRMTRSDAPMRSIQCSRQNLNSRGALESGNGQIWIACWCTCSLAHVARSRTRSVVLAFPSPHLATSKIVTSVRDIRTLPRVSSGLRIRSRWSWKRRVTFAALRSEAARFMRDLNISSRRVCIIAFTTNSAVMATNIGFQRFIIVRARPWRLSFTRLVVQISERRTTIGRHSHETAETKIESNTVA